MMQHFERCGIRRGLEWDRGFGCKPTVLCCRWDFLPSCRVPVVGVGCECSVISGATFGDMVPVGWSLTNPWIRCPSPDHAVNESLPLQAVRVTWMARSAKVL